MILTHLLAFVFEAAPVVVDPPASSFVTPNTRIVYFAPDYDGTEVVE